VTVVNAAGSKLDTYLRREVTYRGQACRVGQSSRATRVTVQLTNDVPADARLPDYVTGRLAAPDRLPVRNSTVELVGVYGARVRRSSTSLWTGVGCRSGSGRSWGMRRCWCQ